jgi:hypothetical protein
MEQVGDKCTVCNGRGFLESELEPVECKDEEGNDQLSFEKIQMPCPNPRCQKGLLPKSEGPRVRK